MTLIEFIKDIPTWIKIPMQIILWGTAGIVLMLDVIILYSAFVTFGWVG